MPDNYDLITMAKVGEKSTNRAKRKLWIFENATRVLANKPTCYSGAHTQTEKSFKGWRCLLKRKWWWTWEPPPRTAIFFLTKVINRYYCQMSKEEKTFNESSILRLNWKLLFSGKKMSIKAAKIETTNNDIKLLLEKISSQAKTNTKHNVWFLLARPLGYFYIFMLFFMIPKNCFVCTSSITVLITEKDCGPWEIKYLVSHGMPPFIVITSFFSLFE